MTNTTEPPARQRDLARGRRIKELMDGAVPPLEPKDVAAALGTTRQAVTGWIGGRKMTYDHCRALANLLGTTDAYIMDGEGMRRVRPPAVPSLPPSDPQPDTRAMSDGHRIDPAMATPALRAFLERLLSDGKHEIWQITTDILDERGYLPGDYVLVERGRYDQSGDVVLVDMHKGGETTQLFRVRMKPYVITASKRPQELRRLLVDDRELVVRGVVVQKIGWETKP